MDILRTVWPMSWLMRKRAGWEFMVRLSRLWAVSLIPMKFQMAVRHYCNFLSAEGDPASMMQVTQHMVEQFEKDQQLLGVGTPTKCTKKNINAMVR